MSIPELAYNYPQQRKSFRAYSATKLRGNSLPDVIQNSKLHLISKQIKTDDVNKILGTSQLLIMNKAGDIEVKEAERQETEQNIVRLRRSLDETREAYIRKENEIARMKNEIEKMKIDEDFMFGKKSQGYSRLEQMRNAVEMQKIKLEEAIITKKTLEKMIDRMKRDKLQDKVLNSKLERDISHKGRELFSESIQAVKTKEFKQRTQSLFERMVKHVEDEQFNRQKSLLLFEKAIISKEEAEKSREERRLKTENLVHTVAKEIILNGERENRTLFLVHKFLTVFMKKEMEREMKRHSKIEQAFQRIRAAVGVASSQQIVEKFLKREETYNDLLTSVANHEKRLAEAQKQNEELQNKLKILKDKNNALDKEREQKSYYSNLNDIYKELSTKTDIAHLAKVRWEQTHSWAIKALIKMDKSQHVSTNKYHELFPKQKTASALLQVIQNVAQHFRSIKNQDYSKVLDDIDCQKIDEEIIRKEYAAKNVRVKMSDSTSDDVSLSNVTRSHIKVNQTFDSSTTKKQEAKTCPIKKDKLYREEEEEEEEDFEVGFKEQRRAIKARYARALLQKNFEHKLQQKLK